MSSLKFKNLHKYIFGLFKNIFNHNKNISFSSAILSIERAISIVLSSNYFKNINILTKFNFDNKNINIFLVSYINNIFKKSNSNIYKASSLPLFFFNSSNIFIRYSTIKELNFICHIKDIDIHLFKKILLQKIKDLKKRKIIKLYIPIIGNLISGIVMEIFKGGCIIKLDIDYGFLSTKKLLKKDSYNVKDNIHIYLEKIDVGFQSCFLILSRTHKNFVYQLFNNNISNISSNLIMIKNISRNPNFKTQIVVYSINNQIDSVSNCIGFRSSIIKSIMKEIRNEKIDIIKWNNNIIYFFFNSVFLKIRMLRVFFDNFFINIVISPHDKTHKIDKIISNNNNKLISDLILYQINITTKEFEYIKKKEEYINANLFFTKLLNTDLNLSQILISEGLNLINLITFANLFILYKIQYINFVIACELIFRSKQSQHYK